MDYLKTFEFNNDNILIKTDYWSSPLCNEGLLFLIYKKGNYFLLIPTNYKKKLLDKVAFASDVIISKGEYNNKKNWIEIRFDCNSKKLHSILLNEDQYQFISPAKKGWNGELYVFSDISLKCKKQFVDIFYQKTSNLPFTEEIKEEKPSIGDVYSKLTPLSSDEAIKAMKVGERLVDENDRYDLAHYHWHDGQVLCSDSYYDLYGEGNIIPLDKLPQLYRIGFGNFGNMGDRARPVIIPAFEKNEYPLTFKKYGFDGTLNKIVDLCCKEGRPVTLKNTTYFLKFLEKALDKNKKN